MGDLTLHGVMRNRLWIQATIILRGSDIRAQSKFALKQTDYQIQPVSFAAGALKLKDELKFVFELIAHREQSTSATT